MAKKYYQVGIDDDIEDQLRQERRQDEKDGPMMRRLLRELFRLRGRYAELQTATKGPTLVMLDVDPDYSHRNDLV